MCCRYYIEGDEWDDDLSAAISGLNRDVPGLKTQGEIFPGDTAPVLARARSCVIRPFAMRWGFRLPDKRLVINARQETAGEKPLFRDSFQRLRCLVPASHYFEWRRIAAGKQRYAIRAQSGTRLYMAGLYRVLDGRPEFTVLTRPPEANIAFIHDRMPLLLTETALEGWLDAKQDISSFLFPVRYELAEEAVQESLL